jgi:shikimate kinase / 3-dehydroquinate synthase
MSDGIVLTGLPGSGKTTVGRLVAERLGRQLIDIDCEVERTSGSHPAQILARDGEARLRELERTAVANAVTTAGAVIATGGGTVLDPLNRWLLMEHGFRVRLDAPIDQLAARLRADTTTPRPLLGGDLESGLARTAETRTAVYAAVDAVVDASGAAESTADAVIAAQSKREGGLRPLLDMEFERHHPMGPPNGRLLMGRGLNRDVLEVGGNPAFVVDRRAPSIVATGARTYEIDGGEQVKTMHELERLLGWLSAANVERSDPLVVIGGGTIGDLGGLAAALHRRGVPLVNVPTTWLAQADSAIGGKVAIDLPDAKNGVGTFWPAWLIAEDADVLATLPVERRRDGMAECLKAGLIGDPALWQLVEERAVAALNGDDPAAAFAITERAVRLKIDIVNRDPFETGERRTLNLGHTIGHALEIESGYTLAHGAAVALGLRAVAHISQRRGAQPQLAQRIDAVLAALGFDLVRSLNAAAVIAATAGDKKRERGVQRWILPMAVGEVVEVNDVTAAELDAALGVIAA